MTTPPQPTHHLLAHLHELRLRLLLVVAFFALAWVGCYSIHPELFAWLTGPLRAAGEGAPLIFTGVGELFFTYLKLSAWVALLVTLPVALTMLWGFVAPGLYPAERQWVWPLMVAAPALFIMGAGLAFYGVLPLALQFFLSFAEPGVQALPSVKEYLGFALNLVFGFGLAFQLPLLLVALVRLGVITPAGLARGRRLAIVGIFIVAGVLTPPDPVSQVLLALPLVLLYEITVRVAKPPRTLIQETTDHA